MPKKLTTDLFIERLNEIHPGITLLSQYKNRRTSIKLLCECGNEYESYPQPALQGYGGCPDCVRRKINIKNKNNFDEWINQNRPGIKRIGEYIDAKTNILMQCECGNYWNAKPSHIKYGMQCSKCGKEKMINSLTKSHDKFVEEMQQVNPNIAIIGTYIKGHDKILCQCKICKSWWEPRANAILCGEGCPICNKFKSRGEQFISTWLKDNDIEFEEQYRIDYNNHRHYFDFYIPSLNTFIEYDGAQHYEPVKYFGGEEKFQKQQERDAEKNQWCSDNGYELIRIKYDIPFEEIVQILKEVI